MGADSQSVRLSLGVHAYPCPRARPVPAWRHPRSRRRQTGDAVSDLEKGHSVMRTVDVEEEVTVQGKLNLFVGVPNVRLVLAKFGCLYPD